MPTLGTPGPLGTATTTEPPPAVSIPPETVTTPGEAQVGDLLTVTDGWVQNIDGHLT
jgi:hypothetical protein